jgi:nicotinate-nucleotide adenylyltransferase
VAARRCIRLGVLGGTFDPIHHVHLLMAREAMRRLALDNLLFVPTGEPSHRDPAVVSSASDRCAMVRLALIDEPRFALSTVDAERSRPTYTVDTVRDLRAQHGPATDLYVIVGADNLINVPRWHESAELLRLAHIVGSSRLGHRLVDPGLPSDRLTFLQIPRLDISATKIRGLVRDRRSVPFLTPKAVARYIHDHGLYATEPPPQA